MFLVIKLGACLTASLSAPLEQISQVVRLAFKVNIFTIQPHKGSYKTNRCMLLIPTRNFFLHKCSYITIKEKKILPQLYAEYFKTYPAVFKHQSTSPGYLHVNLFYSCTRIFSSTVPGCLALEVRTAEGTTTKKLKGMWRRFFSGLDSSSQQISNQERFCSVTLSNSSHKHKLFLWFQAWPWSRT